MEVHPYDFGYEHVVRLAQHHGFRFNASDSPSQYRQAVDHSRVRVGPDASVGERDRRAIVELLGQHCRCQVFKIDLVHDASPGWHDEEVVKR